MSLLQIFMKGGVVMIILAIGSVLGTAIIIERIITLLKIRINTRTFVLQIKNMLLRGRVEEAMEVAKNTRGPIAKITSAGLAKYKQTREEVKDAIEGAAQAEVYQLERFMGILATVAAAAPLFGFLGTVTGMIKAFMQIQNLGGSVDASVLAGGIWEALITTAAGLTIGVWTLIFYNIIQRNITFMLFGLQSFKHIDEK